MDGDKAKLPELSEVWRSTGMPLTGVWPRLRGRHNVHSFGSKNHSFVPGQLWVLSVRAVQRLPGTTRLSLAATGEVHLQSPR